VDAELVQGDIRDTSALDAALAGMDSVIHLAAAGSVVMSVEDPVTNFDVNVVGTFRVLDAARRAGVERTVQASTGGALIGDATPPVDEHSLPKPISPYGASKLAGEGLLQAYAEGFGLRAFIFRFVSILGERYTHGHVFDFCKKLKADPARLPILGDGQQRKSYLYVGDCLEAILAVIAKAEGKVCIYNLGTDEFCQVNDSVGWICGELGLQPAREYSGGTRGWVGDSPFIYLDKRKVRALGWSPKLGIREGVVKTVAWIRQNPWVFEQRS